MTRAPFTLGEDHLDYEPAPVEENLQHAYALLERLGHHAAPPVATGTTGPCEDCGRTTPLFQYGKRDLCHRCTNLRRDVAANITEAA